MWMAIAGGEGQPDEGPALQRPFLAVEVDDLRNLVAELFDAGREDVAVGGGRDRSGPWRWPMRG